MLSKLFRPFLILPALLLSSCIEGEEEISINADGSGWLIAHYSIPSIALSQLGNPDDYVRAIKRVDEREEGIEVQVIRFEVKNGKALLHLEATFENALNLLEISARNESLFVEEAAANPQQLSAITGDIEVGMDGLSPNFKRAISLGPIFPAMVQNTPAMLGASYFKYTIHLPAEVEETNAHEVSSDKRTVTWNFLLRNCIDQPMVMLVKTKLPIPWWIMAIAAALLSLIAWAIWKRQGRRNPDTDLMDQASTRSS